MSSLSPPTTYTLKTPKPSCYKSTSNVTHSSLTGHSDPPALAAKRHLLRLIADQDRGLKTQSNPRKLAEIIGAIDSLAAIGRGTVTTDETLSATWRMLWTTEKEQLFVIKNARVFGTAAGDVLQVIDTAGKSLNNVITFPPDGVFFVRSDIQIASPQRVNFQFTSAVLRGKGWEIPLPPFGQGWQRCLGVKDSIPPRRNFLYSVSAIHPLPRLSVTSCTSLIYHPSRQTLGRVRVRPLEWGLNLITWMMKFGW